MKRFVLSAVATGMLLASCTTEREARKNLVFKAEGHRSVNDVADCISRQFKGTSDIFLTRDLTQSGVVLKVVARGQFGTNVLHVVDIYRRDETTYLEAHSPGKRAPDKLYEPYAVCLTQS